MKKLLFLMTMLVCVTPLWADTKYPELEKLELKYRPQVSNGSMRDEYLIKLAGLYFKYAHAENPPSDGWKAVMAEIVKYPLPVNIDGKKLNKLAVGMWASPRHNYVYRANGTWSMLPADEDSTRGTWHISGNQFSSKAGGDDEKADSYTIYLLDGDNFFYGDKTVVFFTSKLAKEDGSFKWGYRP